MTVFTQEQQYESALRLHGILNGLGDRGFGYFMGGKLDLCNNLHIAGHPERTVETRGELKELMEGLSLVYLFALWDDHIQNEYLVSNFSKTELRKFRAFKHVRHTVSHSTTGRRANQNREDFEAEMPFAGIKHDMNADKISIGNSSVTWASHALMSLMSGKLAVKLYQSGYNQSP
jgi:hypothetical protein